MTSHVLCVTLIIDPSLGDYVSRRCAHPKGHNLRISTTFVRELRKILLVTGENEAVPKAGFEDTVATLSVILRSLQKGAYAYALDLALREGIDLERLYLESLAARRNGSSWRITEEALRKFGGVVRFSNWETEPYRARL